jgi:hypothetical protein
MLGVSDLLGTCFKTPIYIGTVDGIFFNNGEKSIGLIDVYYIASHDSFFFFCSK